MEFKTITYLDENGTLSPNCPIAVDQEELLKVYKTLALTRYIDEKMITLQRQGAITFCLTSLGEEICAIGAAAALDLDDWIYPQYRESGAILWRGFSAQDYIHQMFGNAKDLGKGRQMPNHFGSKALNVVTVSSPIGTKIPHAAGAAYAMKLQKKGSCALCFFGDGATSEGDFHAGLNFAAVTEAPVIFFCRNNGYAISTPTHEQYRSEGIAPKAIAYGIRAIRVDGNDFFAVKAAVYEAKQHRLPVLIEAMTYRMGAHSTSDDPTRYRPEGELESLAQRDPKKRLYRFLVEQNFWDEGQEEGLRQSIEQEVSNAIEVAKKTPPPSFETLIEDVYFETPSSLKEQLKRALESHE